MHVDLVLVAAPVVKMEATNGSWLGNAGSGFLALIFLGVSYALAKKEAGPWGPRLGKKLGNVSWDWKSLMSAVFGFLGVTAALGATGWLADFSGWMQSLFIMLGAMDFINTIGMAGICVLVGLKVWLHKDDNIHDLTWGGVAALAFPLGGGVWTKMSLGAGNFLLVLMNGVPNA